MFATCIDAQWIRERESQGMYVREKRSKKKGKETKEQQRSRVQNALCRLAVASQHKNPAFSCLLLLTPLRVLLVLRVLSIAPGGSFVLRVLLSYSPTLPPRNHHGCSPHIFTAPFSTTSRPFCSLSPRFNVAHFPRLSLAAETADAPSDRKPHVAVFHTALTTFITPRDFHHLLSGGQYLMEFFYFPRLRVELV